MTEPAKVVFLSYASQDAAAARCIAEALRAAGIEVWFDQSELRGGDAWDQNIRRQIRDCTLFVPIISANTRARSEGYFRLEWHLADQRKLLMAKTRPFLVPVCIDGTADADADAPDSFAAVHWTWLPGGDTTSAFVERVALLLSPGPYQAPMAAGGDSAPFARTPIPEKSIAVLPFANLSGDADNEYFSDGLAEEILSALSRVGDLRVASRSSSFSFKGKAIDAGEIAQRLGVANVLEGGVRRAGGRIRITVQLIDARNGFQLWSERYERQMEDVFEIQEAIAREIADRLKVEIGARSWRATDNLEAYNLYLRGRFFWNQRPRASDKALQCLNQAVALEPGFALAHAGIADVYNTLGAWEASVLPPLEAFPKAQAEAVTALELDPHLAEAHTALGYANTHYLWDWTAADRQLRRAVALKPSYGHAHHWLSHLLMARGKVDESLAASRQALQCDPLDVVINVHLAWHHWFARQYDKVFEQCERTAELDANEQWVPMFAGFAHIECGDAARAIDAHRLALKRSNDSPVMLGALGYSYAAGGERKLARDLLGQLEERGAHRGMYGYEMGIMLGALGDFDQAFDCLNRARREHSTWFAYIAVDPRLDRLRNDPRFEPLLRSISLGAG